MNAADYAEKAKDLFVLSDSFLRIKELIDNDSSTIDDISQVILLDPALASTLLKLANSPLFNHAGKIDTISKAVLVLGVTEVYNAVIAYFSTETFKTIEADSAYLESFWSYSIDSALIIKHLASALKINHAERLFILGLLHNLGELVVHQFEAKKVKVCREKAPEKSPWEKQQVLFNFTFAECTAELLKLWVLPYSLVEPIREQNNRDFKFATIETKLLYVAKRLAFKSNSAIDKPISYFVESSALAECDLTEQQAQAAINYCDTERFAILAILSPGASMIY